MILYFVKMRNLREEKRRKMNSIVGVVLLCRVCGKCFLRIRVKIVL